MLNSLSDREDRTPRSVFEQVDHYLSLGYALCICYVHLKIVFFHVLYIQSIMMTMAHPTDYIVPLLELRVAVAFGEKGKTVVADTISSTDRTTLSRIYLSEDCFRCWC